MEKPELKEYEYQEPDTTTNGFTIDFRPPMRLRRWFNIIMIVVNLSVAILLLLLVPLFVGILIVDGPTNWYEWAQTYGVGLTVTGAAVIGVIYWGMIFTETRKSIRRSIRIIRKNYQ